MKVAFRFGHSQVQNEFRPWVNGQTSKRPPNPPNDHPFWILSNNAFFDPAQFTSIPDEGRGWINEVEGLIHQKCPEADLRIENVLTNGLFGERFPGGSKEEQENPKRLKEVGGMRELLNS